MMNLLAEPPSAALGAPFVLFGTGWWGVPSFYFWLVAQSLKLFGDNLEGARVIHALAGIGTVWFTYRVGRVAWSPRAGLIAAALLIIGAVGAEAQNASAPVAITPRLDTPQVRVYIATLQPRAPSVSKNGHATNRVIIYLDDGMMTRADAGGQPARTVTVQLR